MLLAFKLVYKILPGEQDKVTAQDKKTHTFLDVERSKVMSRLPHARSP